MKSHANGPLSKLASAIFIDAGRRCAVGAASIERDIKTMMSRLKHEGISFLTITLPTFCQHFERSLAEGSVTPQFSCGYKKTGCLPSFMRGFTELVFDSGTGTILNEPSIDAILSIRQICLFAKKVSLPCTPERERKALDDYVEIEQNLEHVRPSAYLLDLFHQISGIVWPEVFTGFNDSVYGLLPKHGPGATCERISGNQKYNHKTWYTRLDKYFPSDLYVFGSAEHMLDPEVGLSKLEYIQEGDELPVRVTLVPKTLKGPRIIAIEPVCMQYTQQALASFAIKRMESSRLIGGHVNFTDQSINQSLAMEASVHGKLATLDLSSASDRVPLDLVRCMLHATPEFLEALESCRSSRAQLPSGEVIHLKKFASMGSATCFPVESMYFLTVILTALHFSHVSQVSRDTILHYISRVHVYGDDIVIPADAAEAVMSVLSNFGCKVNINKSFWTGQFRESCGCDAYAGVRVTPTYVRCLPPTDRRNASAIISWTETSNLFYRSGFWETANYMKNVVESQIGELPIVSNDSAAIGVVSFQKNLSIHGWDKGLQCTYVRAYTPCPVRVSDSLTGYHAMLKCLLLLERSSDRNPLVPIGLQQDHLQRSARHGASHIKRRRIPIS